MRCTVKLSSEDLSRYSNKIESVWFKKMSVLSLSFEETDVTITNSSWLKKELAQIWHEEITSLSPYLQGGPKIWHNYFVRLNFTKY